MINFIEFMHMNFLSREMSQAVFYHQTCPNTPCEVAKVEFWWLPVKFVSNSDQIPRQQSQLMNNFTELGKGKSACNFKKK